MVSLLSIVQISIKLSKNIIAKDILLMIQKLINDIMFLGIAAILTPKKMFFNVSPETHDGVQELEPSFIKLVSAAMEPALGCLPLLLKIAKTSRHSSNKRPGCPMMEQATD